MNGTYLSAFTTSQNGYWCRNHTPCGVCLYQPLWLVFLNLTRFHHVLKIDTYSLALSLLDFVPNLAFLVGATYLVRWMWLTKSAISVVTMIVGSFLVLLGGTSKAPWKLLYTLGVGDFWLLGELQFMLLAPGFLAMLVSVVSVLKQERKR